MSDWNALGRGTPLGAILTGESGALQPWDSDIFFATGRADAARFLAELARVAPGVTRGRALDFGCGVGRITRSLAPHFDAIVGVDAAASMIAQARDLNREYGNCSFALNTRPDLAMFDSGSFDVVYCRLVLQHVPRRRARAYIGEFVRVLAPGGVAMFQLPEHVPSELTCFVNAPVQGGSLKRRVPRFVVRAYRCVKYAYLFLTSAPRMRMFGMPHREVTALLERAGGEVLQAVADDSHGIPAVRGFEYWVTNPPGNQRSLKARTS